MNFLGLIWGAVFMATGGLALLPHSLKPKSPIEQQGTFHHVGRQVLLKGPAAVTDTVVVSPDSTCIITVEPSRADSIDAGTVDPQSFTPDEFEEQKQRSINLWLERREFIRQLNGLTDEPWNWTWQDSKSEVTEVVAAVDRHLLPHPHRSPQWP